MNILIIGSGGRESAFAYKLSKSPRLDQLFIAPGNAGTGAYGQNVNIKVTDFAAITMFYASKSKRLSQRETSANVFLQCRIRPDSKNTLSYCAVK